MSKDIYFSIKAREALKEGVDSLSNAVKVTLGPKGRNVIIDKSYGAPVVTKDGVTVAKEVELKDAVANMGAQMVKEVASKTSDIAGDGTTTATVLAQAIFTTGLKNVTAGANPMDLKRGIDKAVQEVIKSLKAQTRQIGDSMEKIEQIAFYDNLTGLPNRKMFEDFFIKEVARAKRQEERVALLMMDLDGFKLVNDTYGHKAGDRVLQVIGERLSASVRIGDTVARLGGDEFIGYLGQLHSEQEALGIAQRIVAACNQPIELEQAETGVGVSIGICFSPRDGADLETLMKKADVAMYQSKAQGKNCVTMYESST